MAPWLQGLITVVCAVIASSGFWAYMESRRCKNNAEAEMLRGLGHDRIIYLCKTYIERGYVTPDEYENLKDYLYKPYRALNGNGTAEKLMSEVEKLPIQNHK